MHETTDELLLKLRKDGRVTVDLAAMLQKRLFEKLQSVMRIIVNLASFEVPTAEYDPAARLLPDAEPEPRDPDSLFGGDDYLTAHQVSALIELTPQHIYRLAREGKIPSVQFGDRTRRFPRQEIRRWIHGKTESKL